MMNFNPSKMMEQRFQQMVQQRFGNPQNMLNEMKKFAGDNATLKNALDLFEKNDRNGLTQIQQNLFNERKLNPMEVLQNMFGMR